MPGEFHDCSWMFWSRHCSRKGARRVEERKKKERKKERKKKTKMTKLDFHRFQVRHFSTLPANNDILLQFPYTKLTCVRILPLVNVLVLLGDELLAVILADVNTNLYLPTPESKLQLIGY